MSEYYIIIMFSLVLNLVVFISVIKICLCICLCFLYDFFLFVDSRKFIIWNKWMVFFCGLFMGGYLNNFMEYF